MGILFVTSNRNAATEKLSVMARNLRAIVLHSYTCLNSFPFLPIPLPSPLPATHAQNQALQIIIDPSHSTQDIHVGISCIAVW